MILRSIFLLSFLFFINSTYAQDTSIKFGKVPSEDIEMLEYELEPDADAVVLAKTSDLSLLYAGSFTMIYHNFERIKIFKETAYDEYGEISFDYYHNKGAEVVSGIKAMITYPDGSSYRLKKNEIYKEKIDDRWTNVKFTFPKLQEGSIIEYIYDLKSQQIFSLDDFVFQSEIPTRYADITFEIPDNIDYIFLKQGLNYIESCPNCFYMENIPSMKKESYITTMADYRGRLKTQIKGYRDAYNVYNPLVTTWPKLMKGLYEDQRFGRQIENSIASKQIIKLAKPHLTSSKPIEEKILALQNFILKNVSWNGQYSLYSVKGIDKAFKSKEANASELNFMMIALLREIGIECYPLLVSTRNHGKLFKLYPFVDQFNYALVYTEIDGKPFIIDVAHKNRPPGLIRFSALNEDALIARKEDGEWIKIEAPKDRELLYASFEIKEDKLVGNIKGKYDAYSAVRERDSYDNGGLKEHWEKKLKNKFADAQVTKVASENKEDLYLSFKEDMDVLIPGSCVSAGDIMYIDPFIYETFDENPFKLEERTFPVDFGYSFVEQYVFTLKIPDEYAIEEIPETISMATEDRKAQFVLNASKVNGQVQIMKKLEILKPIYSPEEYYALKKLFDLILEKGGEQIVLKKI